jgi:shikimate dehydrogenase
VDTIEDSAMEIGAINTIAKNGDTLTGHNTDIHGFMEPLKELSHLIEGGRAIVFGTGGASKAVKAALRQLGVYEIVFVSRNPSLNVITDNTLHIQMADYHQWQSYAEDAQLFVNTTPVGMYPNTEDLFINSDDIQWLENKICYDLIYNPVMTSFLKMADRAGAVVINGLEMFVEQGNRSFELWTQKTFPVKEIEEKLLQHLGHS